MHDTRVELKSGRIIWSPIWEWRPKLGWFTLVEYGKFSFSEVHSMTTRDKRMRPVHSGHCDELQRAREEGWDGT